MTKTLKLTVLTLASLLIFLSAGLFAQTGAKDDAKKDAAADKKALPKELPEERRHPKYALTGLDNLIGPETTSLNPGFVISNDAKLAEGSIWTGSYIPDRLVGLDIADVDSDGLNEVVYATVRNVYLSRYFGGEFVQLASYSLNKTTRVVSVDLYDTDGDGRREIIVSAEVDTNHNASSSILSYDGSKELKSLASGIPYFLRVVGQEGSRVLVAQKAGSSPSDTYGGGVHYASFSKGKLSTSSVFELPFQVNIYNFNVGDLGKDRTRLVANIKFPTEHLVLSDFGGGKVWESHDEYGGTTNFIELFPFGDSARRREFLPSRILIADIDMDGANELIVAKNSQGGSRLFKNLRSFNSGVIEARKFSNLSLVPFFTTGTILSLPGGAADYQIGDFDNNGTKDLVVAVVIEDGSGLLDESRSILYSFNNLYVVPGNAPGATPASGTANK
ncbi:MAG: VCBS repeat-containing protein [Deltaproteobacteria bacterium]|jgi:hypothetical protein|nr:VCBS repeat-containing protein [Deltaproteobacteria bacterium]